MTLSEQVKRLEDKHASMQVLTGEIIATLEENMKRGTLVVCGTPEHYLMLESMVKQWRENFELFSIANTNRETK